jgi:hypothetical protein
MAVQQNEVDATYLKHLSEAAQRKSFDPYRDIDWTVPIDRSHFYLPQDMVSLYGTEIWDKMNHEQRSELSLHEACSTLAHGIWFENILSACLLKYLYRTSPHDQHFYWMYQEVADECRHSMMFAEMIRAAEVPWYQPAWWAIWAGRATKYLSPKVSVLIGTLAAEALTDYLNRRIVQDAECHPIMRQLSRIHMIEEARHLGYARHWLKENYHRMPAATRAWMRIEAPITTAIIASQLVSPKVYSELKLPSGTAKIARKNPARIKAVQAASAELVEFLREIDMIDDRSSQHWRTLHLMA